MLLPVALSHVRQRTLSGYSVLWRARAHSADARQPALAAPLCTGCTPTARKSILRPHCRIFLRIEASLHAIIDLLHALDPPISNRIVATAAPHREIPGPPPIFCHELITERALASRNMHRAQTDAHAPITRRLMDGHDLIRFSPFALRTIRPRCLSPPPTFMRSRVLAQHLG